MLEGLRRRLRRLPWRTKRFLGNLGYGLRLIRGPSRARLRPTITIALIAIFGFAAFTLAGGVYDMLEKPVSLLPRPGQQGWTFIYPGSISVQTLNESLVSALLYLLGVVGLYMLLRSTRFAYRPRNAYLLLILGFMTTIMVIYYTSVLLQQKVG